MKYQEISKQDLVGLQKVKNALDLSFSLGVREYFNKLGKLADFSAVATIKEKTEQLELLSEIFSRQSTYASLKSTDLFLGIARRIGTDEELATCVPHVEKFNEDDVKLLEKCGFKSTAAVVRASLKLG